MYPRSQERHRNREATVYLPALGGDGPRLDRMIRIFKCSQASSREESLKSLPDCSSSEYGEIVDLGDGRITLKEKRADLTDRVISAEQGKPVALLARGTSIARWHRW